MPVDDPIDRIDHEHGAGNQGSLEFVNEVIVSLDSRVDTMLIEPGLLRRFSVAVSDHRTHSFEGICDDGTLRWSDHMFLLAEDEHHSPEDGHAEAQQVYRIEPDVPLHVGGRNQGKRSKVDTPIEDHVDAPIGDGRIDDDSFALRSRCNSHATSLVLICNERSDIGLDPTSAPADDQDCSDEILQVLPRSERGW